MNYHEWRQSKEYIKVSTGLDLSSADKFNQAIEVILEAAFNAGKRLNKEVEDGQASSCHLTQVIGADKMKFEKTLGENTLKQSERRIMPLIYLTILNG